MASATFLRERVIEACKARILRHEQRVEADREAAIADQMAPRSWLEALFTWRAAKTREQAIERLKRPHSRFGHTAWDYCAVRGDYWYREARRILQMAQESDGTHVILTHEDTWIFKE